MKFVISMVLSAWLVAVAAHAEVSATNCNENRSGSIQVQTDHPGFKVLLEGPVRVSGITPFTGNGLPVGKYKIKVLQSGYTSARKSIYLQSNGAESITLDPRPKHRIGAAARSLIIPGWGQKYNDQPTWGTFVFWTNVAAAAGHGLSAWQYLSAREDLEDAVDDTEDAWNRANNAYDIYVATGWTLGVCWVFNVLDALIQFPAYETALFPGEEELSLAPVSTCDGLILSYKVSMK